MSLKDQIRQITDNFTTTIIETLREATLSQLGELDGERGMPHIMPMPRLKTIKGGRLARRSAEEIDVAVGKVVSLLHTSPLRAEQIRVKLHLEPREMPRILKAGVAGKQIAILSGQKRATLYTVAGVGKAGKKVSRKPARKARKK